MDKSIERKNRFLERMSHFNNYKLQRVKAITPADLYNYEIKIPWYCKSMHDKERACLVSHFKAIETSYNNNDNYSIIAEDDMIIEKNINWDYFISILPDDWEIIQLYYFKLPFINNTYFKQLQKNNFLIKTNNILTSAAAYLINKKGMQNILSNIENNNINLLHQKNYCLSDFVIYSNINRYILTYPIIRTEELDSTLNPHYIILRKKANIL
jgi:glycosyl transferase family 25